LPKYTDEIPIDSAVLVIFTVMRYDYQGAIPRVNAAISFNVQRVILLADANEDNSATDPAEDMNAVGCDGVTEVGPLV
jgi:hypothetical protein